MENTNETVQSPLAQEPTKKKNWAKLIILVLFLLLIPLVVYFSFNSKTLLGMAMPKKCIVISKVAISPGEVKTSTMIPAIYISALAYDADNQPILKGVNYKWGISSNNSIGRIKSNQDLVTFFPLNPGIGDIYVNAKNACTKEPVTGSISTTVEGLAVITPTKDITVTAPLMIDDNKGNNKGNSPK